MKKAWSFFWLVVAWCVGLSIMAAIIQPYLGIAALIGAAILLTYVGLKVRRRLLDRRTHY